MFKKDQKVSYTCEVCEKEMTSQPAAMGFRNGNPNDPYYYCYDCSPDPFEALLKEDTKK